MTYRQIAAVSLCAIVATILGYSILSQNQREREAAAYFQKALFDAHVIEDVVSEGVRYRVERGTVSPLPVSQHQAYDVLRRAYALALVRRNPILSIEGTHVDDLERSLQKLERATQSLANIQTTPEDAKKIAHLYPIDFLRSLISLEASRKLFLAEGSSTQLDEYMHALDRAITAGKKDVTAFRFTFDEVVGDDIARAPTLGGMISVDALRSTAQNIETKFATYLSIQRARRTCTRGHVDECNPAELTLQMEEKSNTRPATGPFVDEIRSIVRSATGYTGKEAVVILDESRCLSKLPGPYAFWIRSDSESPIGYARFLNDLYFIPTIPNPKSVLGHLASIGISYSPVNPTAFYHCPTVESDFATLVATRATYDLAASKPVELSNIDLKPRGGMYSEHDARAYLIKTLEQIRQRRDISPGTVHAIEAAVLAFNHTGAGLDALVAQVARIQMGDVRLKEQGIPFDLSARTQFLTHSAFPSFFLAARDSENKSRPSSMSDADELSLFFKRHIRYSDMRSHVPRKEIVDDMNAFITFERQGQNASP